MRRSSRIQIKQENTTAPKCEPIFTENIKTPLQAVENQQCPPTTSGTGSRIPKKRNLKRTRNLVERRRGIVRNSVEGKEHTGKRTIGFRDTERLISEATVTDPIQPITVNKETNIDGAVSPLLAQEESNDSLLSDVANSIKIDRTIKNLSPKKFFINKNGKTTRSGRSFSPYDFATYSLLFGNLCAREDAAKDRRDSAPLKNAHKQVKRLSQSRQSRVKRRNQENLDLKRSKKAKNYRCKQYRRRNKGYLIPREGPADAVSVLRSPVLPSKIEKPDVVEDLYSEEVPAAFFFDFPPTPAPRMEGHSLPPDFYRPYVPVPVDETEAFSPTSTRVRKMEQSELDALSKISLSDSDKYEFKSAFKDAHAQVANFESYSGHEVPGGDVHKFDLMESESVEGRRFYRKRITDSSDQTLILQGGRYTLQAYAGDTIRNASEVTVSLISQSIVGVDVSATLKPMSENMAEVHEPSAVSNQSTTSKPQDEDETRKRNPTISALLDRYSFQPTRSKKLTKDITSSSSSSVNTASESRIEPNYGSKLNNAALGRTITDTRIIGISEGFKSKSSDFHLDVGNSNFGIIEISSSSSSGGDSHKPTNEIAINSVGKLDCPKKTKAADLKYQALSKKDLPQKERLQLSTLKSEVQTQSKCCAETVETEENLGNQNAGRALANFTELEDHTPLTSQEDELNELFFGMSNEDVRSGVLQISSPPNNDPYCEQLIINLSLERADGCELKNSSDSQSEVFKFHEIPSKIRVEYDNVPSNIGRFGWKPPGMHRQFDQVAHQEFIGTQSFFAQTLTTQFHNSQPFTQFISESSYESQPLSVQSQQAASSTQCHDNVCSYSQSALMVASDPSSGPYYSEDPRSLKYASKVQSASALPELYSQNYAPTCSQYVPNTILDLMSQQYVVPNQSFTSRPVYYQDKMPIHYPENYQHFQDYTTQFESSHYGVSQNGFSPVSPPHPSQIPISQLINQRSEPSASASALFRRPESVSGEYSQFQDASQPSRVSSDPTREKLEELFQCSEGHTQLPRPPVFKRRRTTSGDVDDSDSGVGQSVCTNLSSLMTIHGGYSKSLRRNDV